MILIQFLQPLQGIAQTTGKTDTSLPASADTTARIIPPEPVTQTLAEAAEDIRKIRGVPGIVYAVFTKDSILEIKALGYRIFKFKDRVAVSDRFNIGTNTAAFTAYIAAKLVEAKKISWNTPLLKIFPEFSKKTSPVYKNITLQDLLSCRTRIQPFMEMGEWFKIPNYKGNIIAKRKSFTYSMLQSKPNMENFLTGKISFSLAGYVMAAAMMEKVSGKSWENLVAEYIRLPMKISTSYSWPNITNPAAPAGHWNQGGVFHAEQPDTWFKGNPVLYPGQAISINMVDYIKYMQVSLQGLAGEKTKLSSQNFNFLYFGLPDYSLGWNNGSLNNQSIAFHEGLSLLFNCRTEILKEKNIGIIVMGNSGDRDGRGAVLDITHLLEEKYF